MRSQLLSVLTATLSTNTAITVSQELPWAQDGTPLYLKNKKRLYLDRAQVAMITPVPTLDQHSVQGREYTLRAYASVDAKNPPAQLDAAIATIVAAKDSTGIVSFYAECDVASEQQEDTLVFEFEYRVSSIT